MAAFLYRAVDPKGRKSGGVIEAASASAARRALRDRALLPTLVEPTTQAPGTAAPGTSAQSRAPRVNRRTLVLITRQLATLIGAGVRIEDALRTVAEQSGSSRATGLLLTLRAGVLDGRSFADTLDDVPGLFDQFYRASVRAGEASGRLGAVMDHLADHVESRAQNRQTVQLALLYPALLALVSTAVLVGLMVFVVPDIVRVFTARGAELPFLTRALIAVSDSVGTVGPILLGGGVLIAVIVGALLRDRGRRRAWHRTLIGLPGIGSLVRQINAALYASTLATLVTSRVPLSDALTAAAATVPNLHIRARADAAAARVREGVALHRAMAEAQVFPPLLVAMVASGEASGRLGETLTRAADQQNRSIAATVATIVGLVEPGVLLIMGGFVMLLVLSILLPIMGLNELAG